MRYNIMLQIVVSTTLILVGAGTFFAWLQNRPQMDRLEGHDRENTTIGDELVGSQIPSNPVEMTTAIP
ncbi:hypothetical protein [Leptolyngbya sp. CCY15150]|uniref:hypothetical protein n=1 Tax=Leptolyngbya sp. CCY15150 TaxID=2767772 RepID=UPI001951BD78|nr:hypothetical protein [Leptolyngbya sp. CCY15150]